MVEGADRVLAREPAPLGEGLGEALRRDGIELELGVRATAARRDGEDFVLELERRARAARRSPAGGHRPPAARRRDRPGDGRHRGESARHPRRRAPERRGAPVGPRRRDRHLAAHARRRVPGRGRRLQHPRRDARGELRGGAARDLHQPPGRLGGRDRGTVRRHRALAEVAKTATYTHAYAESSGFLTLLSDGERLTGAYALGPEAGEWLQQATLAIRARVPIGHPARHDPAVPELLGDLRRGGQGGPPARFSPPARPRR